MSAEENEFWYMPGSVLNALWGTVMPRLAATVWRAELEGKHLPGGLAWPPPDAPRELVHKDMYAYVIAGAAQKEFWHALNRVRGGRAHRGIDAVLAYFHPKPDSGQQSERRIKLRVIEAAGYDFVLSSYGLDIFIPDNPFGANVEKGRARVLQMYKFRETGKPPISLPGLPASFTDGGDDLFMPIPQLTSPTGAYQVQEDWVRGMASDVKWWISGTSYRGLMSALPRIIASMWYEMVAWADEDQASDGSWDDRTTTARFGDGLRELLEERMETEIPDGMGITVLNPGEVPGSDPHLVGWNSRDVMITRDGLFVPYPGGPPTADQLLDAIEKGQAGNPVFTDSGPPPPG